MPPHPCLIMHFPHSLFPTTFVLGLGSANGGALGGMGPSCLVKLESLSLTRQTRLPDEERQ